MNSLNVDLSGKRIVLEGNGPEAERIVKVHPGTEAGFGSHPDLRGTAVFGIHESTGKPIRVHGMEVEKILD